MAVLTEAQREEVFAAIMQRLPELSGQLTGLLKSEWKTLIAAADDFSNDNAAVYNQTIPLAVRNKATAQEKALAYTEVVEKRYQIG